MPAPNPTAIVRDIILLELNPTDATKVDFTIEFNMLFTPGPTSPPLVQQSTFTVDGGFTKQEVKNAAQATVVAAAAAQGGSLSTNRIFGVDDLV